MCPSRACVPGAWPTAKAIATCLGRHFGEGRLSTRARSGEMTAGCDKQFPVDYSHLNILGFASGAKAIGEANPNKAIFPEVDTTAADGHMHPVRMRMPSSAGRWALPISPGSTGRPSPSARLSQASLWSWGRASAGSTRKPNSTTTAG